MQARTKKEALTHIIAELDAGRLGAREGATGGCVYEETGPRWYGRRHCAVGCLFTPEQHAWIQENKLNSVGIKYAVHEIGADNLKFMSGMTPGELLELQRLHDSLVRSGGWQKRFRAYLTEKLAAC